MAQNPMNAKESDAAPGLRPAQIKCFFCGEPANVSRSQFDVIGKPPLMSQVNCTASSCHLEYHTDSRTLAEQPDLRSCFEMIDSVRAANAEGIAIGVYLVSDESSGKRVEIRKLSGEGEDVGNLT